MEVQKVLRVLTVLVKVEDEWRGEGRKLNSEVVGEPKASEKPRKE
jgi:hypothetical protein